MTPCRNWGLPLVRVEEFFLSQGDVEQIGANHFRFGHCEIQVCALPDQRLGSLVHPRTQVEFFGDSTDIDVIYRRFVLNFLSAGG